MKVMKLLTFKFLREPTRVHIPLQSPLNSALLAFLGILMYTTFSYAAQVTLKWHANKEPDLAGYKVYQGTSSRNYDTWMDIGNWTDVTIADLEDNRTYYFSVTAYDTYGNESGYSSEVCTSGCELEPVCGDGKVDSVEECDEGANNSNAPDAFCRTDCTLAGCGDGIVDSGEECDDGNLIDNDTCSNGCLLNVRCPNVVTNGDFSEGKQPWNFYTNGSGNYSVVEGEARVAITTQGTNVQLSQRGLTLEGNTLYRLRFRARHSTGRDLMVALIKHTSPYTNYGLNQTIDLTETMQIHSVEFMTRRGAKTDGRLLFSMGSYDQDGTTYYIDDVAIEKVLDCR